MTQSDFQKLFDERVAKLIETGKTKGVKYTVSAEDRLGNFKSLMPRMTPLQVWEVFFSKHWSAIQYYLSTGKNIGEDICDTHIHDCIMYLFLLEGIVKESRVNKIEPKPWDGITRIMVYSCDPCKRTFHSLQELQKHNEELHA